MSDGNGDSDSGIARQQVAAARLQAAQCARVFVSDPIVILLSSPLISISFTGVTGVRSKLTRPDLAVLSVDDSNASILSPLLSNLPSISGISSIKGFLPLSPPKQPNGHAEAGPSRISNYTTWAEWQDADLGDGQGKSRVLLTSSLGHALQTFVFQPGAIPDDPHVPETFPAPEEVVSVPKVVYADDAVKSALIGVTPVTEYQNERVLSARILDKSSGSSAGKLIVAAVTSIAVKRPVGHGHLAIVFIDLHSGQAIRRIDLGVGLAASIVASPRALAIMTSHPTPSIYVINSTTFLPSHAPMAHLPCDPRTFLPVMDLSGRLLALATNEPASTPGADGLGSIVTGASGRARSPREATSSDSPLGSPNQSTTQAALLTSAAEIGGGVARGVWAGLKMGVRAAGRASGTRLARSAPAESGRGLSDDEELVESEESEPRSVEEDDSFEDSSIGMTALSDGRWIKVLDLFPRRRSTKHKHRRQSRAAKEDEGDVIIEPAVVAHFRLPPAHTLMSPLSAEHSKSGSYGSRHRRSEAHDQSVVRLTFSPTGTHLFAAPADGRSFHVLELRPAAGIAILGSRGSAKRDRLTPRSRMDEARSHQRRGEVWHLYELRRGNTAADVCSVTWSDDARWIAVGTGKGTVHIFAVCPYGGTPSAATHVSTRVCNQTQLFPLSTIVNPVSRLRPLKSVTSVDDLSIHDRPSNSTVAHAVATFAALRAHPLARGIVCTDIAVFRLGLRQVELARLSSHAVVPDSKAGMAISAQTPNGVSSGENGTVKRRSNLTEMMKERAGLVRDSDLSVEHAVKARWSIPSGDGVVALLDTPNEEFQPSRPSLESGNRRTTNRSLTLAHAEIQTHSSNPRILPGPIYLSRQIDFFSAIPTDEYTPESVLDREARTGRLIFRHEVEARPTSPDIQSFDEPLSFALHSIIEARPEAQLPHLPNGYPSRPRWTTVPIRHAVAGLGEGVDRVRREYVRQQHSRMKRRASEAAGNNLSFEEGTVFPSRDDAADGGVTPGTENHEHLGTTVTAHHVTGLSADLMAELDADADVGSEDVSSRSSAMLQTSSDGGNNPDEGWGEGWEEEYRRAVEEDGGPDDLVLGVMDEEEEDRARWELRQKMLAKQYAA